MEKVFKNDIFAVSVKEDQEGTLLFDVENVAKNLGLTTVAKSGNTVVRWKRVNDYLSSLGYSDEVKKGDFLAEQFVYLLAMKAGNKNAIEFQKWLAFDVVPRIRKDGLYITDDATEEQKAYNYKMLDVIFNKIGAEFFMDEYKKCIEFHVKNKTRLEYEKSNKNRRKDKKKTVAESKITIMRKILKVAKEREQQYRRNFQWELKSLMSEVVKTIELDIKEVKHNQTRGRLAQANKKIG